MKSLLYLSQQISKNINYVIKILNVLFSFNRQFNYFFYYKKNYLFHQFFNKLQIFLLNNYEFRINYRQNIICEKI